MKDYNSRNTQVNKRATLSLLIFQRMQLNFLETKEVNYIVHFSNLFFTYLHMSEMISSILFDYDFGYQYENLRIPWIINLYIISDIS